MKLTIILALIVIAQSAPTSNIVDLFTEAWRIQNLLSPSQKAIDSDVTQLRESLTIVLEKRSKGALEEIESNVLEILAIETPFQEQIAALPEGSCKNNLQQQLNMRTEFTGFTSSLCVTQYDKKAENTITEAQEFIANYEGLFVRLQKVVIESFSGNNALIHQAAIIEEFDSEYQARLAEWEEMKPLVEDFEYNLDTTMGVQESELNSCLQKVRDEVEIEFEKLVQYIVVCEEFECYTGTEFMCQNQRCIPLILQCDGFNHCGDNSDEPESCTEQWENSLYDKRWYSHTPNYYFPKNDRYPDFQSTTMAFALSSCSLLLVISCLIFIMYRNGNRVREQEELQNQLQTISQLLDVNNNNRPDEPIEPPPIYEAPPNYEEIIKIGMEDEINKARKDRRSGRKSRLHKPRRSDPAVSVQSALLEITAGDDSDLPSTSSLGTASPFYVGNEVHDSFLSSVQMLDIEETSETPPPASNQVNCRTYQTSNSLPQNLANTTHNESPKAETTNDTINFKFPTSSSLPNSSTLYSPRPNHLWSDESKYKKSWIVFSSDDVLSSDCRQQATIDFDQKSIVHMQEVDNYFQSYTTRKIPIQPSRSEDSFVSMKSCFCDSTQSIFSDKFKTSLLTNKPECNRCKNFIYQYENRRCSMCGDCVEHLYSPKVCMSCNGRISFQDLKNANVKHFEEINFRHDEMSAIKLCNCFPKYPSQNFSSIQPADLSEIQILPKINGKSCSYNEIIHQPKKRSTQYFSSHNCLPIRLSTSSSSDETSDEE
ncbi:hypothetical protein PVAND_007735 [Polypedilum vanderplanki]|uniref:Uncharacterized protein n=1 Tax=Polypedilum vanderplanki TaxID=319348 RepID=A0A9J6C796_POLVA|nr:hypothetical protein PVAND_007735 [Polypedilum vanderplanki]